MVARVKIPPWLVCLFHGHQWSPSFYYDENDNYHETWECIRCELDVIARD